MGSICILCTDVCPYACLVNEFGWGALTPQQVQKICHLAKQDHEQNAKTDYRDALAGIGASGADTGGNMARDLRRTLPGTRLPSLKFNRIPIRHKLIGRGRPLMPFLYPHEMFAALYHEYPNIFFTLVAPPGEVERFWDEVKGGAVGMLPKRGLIFRECSVQRGCVGLSV